MLFALRPTSWASDSDTAARSKPLEVFKGAFKLILIPKMLMLTVTFCYCGLLLTFWSGVYGTAIGRTKSFGGMAKSLIGLNGVAVGVGEIFGGNFELNEICRMDLSDNSQTHLI